MIDREVELLAIGGGPSNLALAVALEELGPDDLAENSLVVERAATVEWQQGLLLPWAKSQVSFVKDLVTLRNPRSEFSFLNYLHSVGRLDDFVNMGCFTPYRIEVSEYLKWVANALTKVRLRLGCGCTSIEALRDARGGVTRWLAHLSDGTVVSSRYLVIGVGRDPYVPPVFDALPPHRLVHSTQYRPRVAAAAEQPPARVAVLGSGQSAAEMFRALQTDLPNADVTWVMRSIGLKSYEKTQFTNELYYPSFVDDFFQARPEARDQLLREMHRTNYSGIEPALLESLYQDVYLGRLTKQDQRRIMTMMDVTTAAETDGEVALELVDRKTGAVTRMRQDLIFLGTGFVRQMPAVIRGLGQALDLERIEVTRRHRLLLPQPSVAACYLQGVSEATHGIADSLLSVLACRVDDIVRDILAHRNGMSNGHDVKPEPFVSASPTLLA